MQHVATFAHKSIPQVSIFNARQLFRVLRSLPGRYFKKKANQIKTCKPSVLFRKRNTATSQLFTASPQSFQAPRSSGDWVIFSFWIVQW